MSTKNDVAFLTGYLKEVIRLAKAGAEVRPERHAEGLVQEGFARRPDGAGHWACVNCAKTVEFHSSPNSTCFWVPMWVSDGSVEP